MEWIGRFQNIFTCHSNTNFLVIRYFQLLYIPLHKEKLSNFMCIIIFTYLDTYVCIFTLNRQTIPCNCHIDKPWQDLPLYWNHVSVLSAPIPMLGQPEQSRYSVLGRSITVLRIRSTRNNKWSSPSREREREREQKYKHNSHNLCVGYVQTLHVPRVRIFLDNLTSPHFTSPHLTSPHFTSHHLT